MTCVICKHGETSPGQVTVTLQRGETTIIIKRVPAQVCENCGEYYLDEATSQDLMQRAEQAATAGAEVEILRYAA
jgi:YgiT-type zinc finger domain-containing protein